MELDITNEMIEREPMLKFFRWKHLPDPLAGVSRMFGELAIDIAEVVQRSPERTVCLRKLLESKDCAVRAMLD